MNIGRYAAYWAKMRGDCVAAVFKDTKLTWAEVNRQADAIAAEFQRRGVKKGDRIGCLLPNRMEWVITIAAAFKAGAILVPLNPRYGEGELREICAQVKCAVIVSLPGIIERLSPGKFANPGDDDTVHLYAQSGNAAPIRFADAVAKGGAPTETPESPDDVAVVTFTSGSTGLPKGAMLTHTGIQALVTSLCMAFRWTSEEQVLMLAPFAFTGGIISVYMPTFVIGACIHIEEALDPERALATIAREKISAITGVPILWERMAASPNFDKIDWSCLRCAVTGGAPVPVTLLQRYLDKGVSIRQTYGVTENCGLISAPNEKYAAEKPWACGWPLPTTELKVVNAENQLCAVGETGEILLRGEQIFKGYWENPEANAAAWFEGWYRTGDLGRLDELGHLQIMDRKKNMVISGGVNVYPAEVERAMGAIPGVAEVIAFGMPDETWGERLVAIVHGAPTLDAMALMVECRRALGDYKTPKELIISSKLLPRTSSGKVSRADVSGLYASMSGEKRITTADVKKAQA